MKQLVYLLGIIGSVGSLIFSFEFSSSPLFIFSVCIIVGTVIFINYQKSKDKRKFVIINLGISGILLLFPATISCLSYLISVVIHKYRDVSVYSFNFQSSFVFYDDPFACTITFLMIFIPMFLLAAVAIDRRKYILSIIALLPGVFIELLFTITPPWYFLGCYVLFALVLLIATMQKGPALKKPMIILSAAAMILTYLIFPLESYRISKYSLFQDSQIPLSTPGNVKEEYDVARQGNRYYRNAYDFTIGGATSLTNFKIRGIAYDAYTDGKWGVLDKESVLWFEENLERIVNITKASRQTVSINQLSGFNRRVYTPYFTLNNDTDYHNNYYEGSNPQSHEMIIPNDDFNAVLGSIGNSNREKLLQEIAIRNGTESFYSAGFITDSDFDSSVYTQIDEETSAIIEQFLNQNNISDNGNIFDYITKCNNALAQTTQYTLSPDVIPSDENALDYFLNINKKGYCVHYASALALMLRYANYPSRFALGYQVPGTVNSFGKLVVTDSNSHAWIEIYDEYLGWIPIEATPASSENTNIPSDSITPTPSQVDDVEDNNDQANQNKPTQPVEIKQDKSDIPDFVYYLLAIFTLIVVFIIQAMIRRKMMFKGVEDNNQWVCYYYHYLSKLEIDCSAIKDLVNKARFSQYQLNDDEVKLVKEFYKTKTAEYYRQLNVIKKIYIKYILVRL